jgi:hypothetical protein
MTYSIANVSTRKTMSVNSDTPAIVAVASQRGSPWEVFRVALRLGCTSFGGPIAHLEYAAGTLTFADLIDSQRTLVAARLAAAADTS